MPRISTDRRSCKYSSRSGYLPKSAANAIAFCASSRILSHAVKRPQWHPLAPPLPPYPTSSHFYNVTAGYRRRRACAFPLYLASGGPFRKSDESQLMSVAGFNLAKAQDIVETIRM